MRILIKPASETCLPPSLLCSLPPRSPLQAKSPSAPRSAVKKEEDEEDVVVEDGGTPARPARPDPSQQILPEELEVPGETMEQRRAREDLILDKAAVMEAILHNSKCVYGDPFHFLSLTSFRVEF